MIPVVDSSLARLVICDLAKVTGHTYESVALALMDLARQVFRDNGAVKDAEKQG
jgi:hypothetical protein